MRVDSVATLTADELAAVAAQKDAIERKRDQIGTIEKRIAAAEDEIQRVRSSRQIVAAGAVQFQPMDPVLPAMFDLEKKDVAIAIGILLASVVMSGMLLLSGRPQSASPESRSR
jgi:hypothetical protein